MPSQHIFGMCLILTILSLFFSVSRRGTLESEEEVMRYTVYGASLMKVMTVKRACHSHPAREATSLTEVIHYISDVANSRL